MKEKILETIKNWTLNHFFITFIILVIINVFFLANSTVPALLKIIAFLLLVAYIILFLVARIKNNINKLLHHELKFNQILTGYITSVIFMVLLFSMIYWGMMLVGAGYLKYGSCIDNVPITQEIIIQDPLAVKSFWHHVYFTSITFFSTGFGDECPMGMSKTIAMINALIGNAFTVLILAMAITNYSTSKSEERKKKK